LVFWMNSALTGPPPRRARASPVRIGPISLMSSSRGLPLALAAPFSRDLSSRQVPEFEWKAPPPRYCQAPVMVGTPSAACIETAPLRPRVKP